MKKYILIILSLIVLSFSGCSSTNINIPDNSINTLYKPLYQYLSLTGNVSGNIDGINDYSVNKGVFYIQPKQNEIYRINRLLVHISDTGSFDSGRYGNNIILNNGITINTKINGISINLTDSQPIKTNGQWGQYTYDLDHQKFGVGDEFMNIRLSFFKSSEPIILKGSNNDTLSIILNDNFVGLNRHTFLVQGIVLNNIIYQ